MKRNVFLLLTALFALLTFSMSAFAQDDMVVISLTVPSVLEDWVDEQIISDFEAQNPGIDVHIVPIDGFDVPIGGATIEEYLDSVEEYVSSADVVLMDSTALNSEITRTGYLLDLYPLVNSDMALDNADFYSAVWQSFQWDGGMWTFPVAWDATIMVYDPIAFDAAGLAYPNEEWTIHDIDFAIRNLTVFDADNNVVSPGFVNFGGDLGVLFMNLSGQSLYDHAVLPTVPDFDNPELENIMTIWNQLQLDGYLGFPQDSSFDASNTPLQLTRTVFTGFKLGDNQVETVGLLPPGGRSGLFVGGFAISSGTQHPQEAYELIKFLSQQPGLAMMLGGKRGSTLSPENEALFELALENGIPTGEALFSEYIGDVLNIMQSQGLEAADAFDAVELTILDNFSVADERRATVQITVAGPPSIEVAPGEIVINFGISSFTSPLPNADVWEQMALDFAASDPKVGLVILDEALKTDVIELTTDYDCFYMDTNIVTNTDVSWLRSLDPLLSSDLTFSPNDIVGDVLRQVQINDQTWAMPLMLQPAVMRYEPDISDQAGAYSPQGSWSVDQFEDALRMLALYLADDTIPYQPRSFDNSYLLMLIASYGGLPLDYRTDPLTIDFTAPDTIEAIRQVLDLAEEGYFEYIPLAGGDKFVIDGEIVVPLYGQILNTSTVGGGIAFDGKGGRGNSADSRRDQPTSNITTYPQSSQYVVALGQYTVVSYDLSAAYISDSTQHVEACYRFISEMAQNPDFITVMPVRYSAIDSPDILVAQGQSNVDFYNSLAETLLQANIIELPVSQTRLKAYGNYITTYWLNRVFDRYVLEDADLEEELADAELFTLAYLECANAIPPFDPATGDNQRQYYTQFNDCATQTDPTFGS